MGNGPLAIGIGQGDAGIWNASPAIAQFGNIIAQQRAQKAAQDKALIDQMASLKSDGIRDPDRDDYLNKYNDWATAAKAANNLQPNSRERLDALATAQSKYNDLGQFIAQSKAEKANEHQLANQWIGNQHLFDDNSHQKFMNSLNSPMSSGSFVPGTDYQKFERYIDAGKIDNDFDKWSDAYKKQLPWSNPISSQSIDKQGNKTGVVTHNEKQGDPADQLAQMAHIASVRPDVQAMLQKTYGNIDAGDPKATMMARLRQYGIDRGELSVDQKTGQLKSEITDQTKPEFKQNWRPRQTTNVYVAGNSAPQTIPTEDASGKQIGVFSSPNYLPMSKAGINMAGVPSVNLQTMQPEQPLKSSNKYNIVGLTSAPIANRDLQVGNKTIPKGSLLQHDFATAHPEATNWQDMAHVQEDVPADKDEGVGAHTVDHLVPQNLLPNTLTGTKAWKTQTANYRSYHGANHAVAQHKDPLGLGL